MPLPHPRPAHWRVQITGYGLNNHQCHRRRGSEGGRPGDAQVDRPLLLYHTNREPRRAHSD
jgi:hypothetical protein